MIAFYQDRFEKVLSSVEKMTVDLPKFQDTVSQLLQEIQSPKVLKSKFPDTTIRESISKRVENTGEIALVGSQSQDTRQSSDVPEGSKPPSGAVSADKGKMKPN